MRNSEFVEDVWVPTCDVRDNDFSCENPTEYAFDYLFRLVHFVGPVAGYSHVVVLQCPAYCGVDWLVFRRKRHENERSTLLFWKLVFGKKSLGVHQFIRCVVHSPTAESDGCQNVHKPGSRQVDEKLKITGPNLLAP